MVLSCFRWQDEYAFSFIALEKAELVNLACDKSGAFPVESINAAYGWKHVTDHKNPLNMTALLAQFYNGYFRPTQNVKEDPQKIKPVPFHSFEKTTHSVLRVTDPSELDSPGPVCVNIFNGSGGTAIELNSNDTIGKLKQEFLKMKPEFGDSLDLVYNGKPVEAKQTLAELQVKHGATFLTFQKCHGG